MPDAGFVRLRFGMFEGPCLATVENWAFHESGGYRVDLPAETFRYFDQDRLIAVPMAISFSPEARVIEPAPLILSTGHRFGQAPRASDLLECARSADYAAAQDATVDLELIGVSQDSRMPASELKLLPSDRGVFEIPAGGCFLKIDLDESRRRQFSAERFKIMVYVNDVSVYEQWDGHIPCMVNIDLAGTGSPEGLLVVNLYTFFDRLAVGYLPFSLNNSPDRNNESGG